MRDEVAFCLHLKNGPLCDDCLSESAGIKPRQIVNDYCRRLCESGRIIRQLGDCPECGKKKLVNALPAALAVALGIPTQDSAFPPRVEEKRNEKWLQEWIFVELYAHFRRKASLVQYREDGSFSYSRFDRMFMIDKEAELEYCSGGGRGSTHKTDLLLSIFNPQVHWTPILNVEIKYKSSVTDAFKARAYDQINLKRGYPDIRGVLAYVKPQNSGISFEQCKQICGCFDCFVLVAERDLYEDSVWKSLIEYFDLRMESVAKDAQFPAVKIEETSGQP